MEATSKVLVPEGIEVKDSLSNPNIIQPREKTKNIIAQLKPAANTYWAIYTAFGWEDTKWLFVCNTSTATTVWIHVVPKWWTADTTNAIWYSWTLAANETKIFSDIYPASWYTIRVKSTSGNVCFTYNTK